MGRIGLVKSRLFRFGAMVVACFSAYFVWGIDEYGYATGLGMFMLVAPLFVVAYWYLIKPRRGR